MNTGPIRLARGTLPQRRESQDSPRLSPMKKYEPAGTRQIRSRSVVSSARRFAWMYGSRSFSWSTQM
ncbi:MAG: hypothetical protein QOG06_654 [Gaiellaceae bacterium]|jgi:hypothetical protein|nr:hypothetical protein [Gaiellaceae bacterium]